MILFFVNKSCLFVHIKQSRLFSYPRSVFRDHMGKENKNDRLYILYPLFR